MKTIAKEIFDRINQHSLVDDQGMLENVDGKALTMIQFLDGKIYREIWNSNEEGGGYSSSPSFDPSRMLQFEDGSKIMINNPFQEAFMMNAHIVEEEEEKKEDERDGRIKEGNCY